MKYPIILAFAVITIATGCTSSETRKQASGDFEYLKVTEAEMLKVPEDLTPPATSNRYELPEVRSEKKMLGPQVLVESPRLVLPLVSGSYVEEGSNKATVLFDQVNDGKPLNAEVWDTVLSYLESNSIGVESFDRENNVLITDWVVSQKSVDSSWYDFSDEILEQARKFKLTVDLAPHGRTASLNVEKIAFIDENGVSQLENISPFELRENEVTFLNLIIKEYDFGIRLAQNQRLEMIRDGFNSELGFNPDGEPAFIVDAIYGNTWPRLLLVLRKMGFDVTDLDQSSGLIFVQYNGPTESWWEGFFSDDGLQLEKTNYRLLVQSLGEKTAVTFKNNDNNAFEADEATDLFSVFSEYMAEQNLDI